MNYREATKRLKALGCIEIRRHSDGSHRKWYNPKTGAKITVPDWGPKDLKLGTLRSAVETLGLDWYQFQHTE